MRRALSIVAAAILLAVLPLTVSGCWIACGCSSLPDPNWTPPPVTAQDAESAVAKFATGGGGSRPSDLAATLAYSSQDHPVYVVDGATLHAVVDAHSGLVLEFVVMSALPNSTDAVISSDNAQVAAARFLSDRGWYTDGLTVTTALRPGVATSAYVVTWAGTGFDTPGMWVYVNPASGAPFAFADQRYGVKLVPPSIGSGAAGRLALAAVSTPGLVVMAPNFSFSFGQPTWDVNLSSPAIGDAAPEHGAVVTVDAVTGATTVDKSF